MTSLYQQLTLFNKQQVGSQVGFLEWFFQPAVFFSLYITIGLITFFLLYYAYTKDKLDQDGAILPEHMLMMVLVLAALLWPIAWIRWIRLDPGFYIEIEWDDNSWVGKLRLKVKKWFSRKNDEL